MSQLLSTLQSIAEEFTQDVRIIRETLGNISLIDEATTVRAIYPFLALLLFYHHFYLRLYRLILRVHPVLNLWKIQLLISLVVTLPASDAPSSIQTQETMPSALSAPNLHRKSTDFNTTHAAQLKTILLLLLSLGSKLNTIALQK